MSDGAFDVLRSKRGLAVDEPLADRLPHMRSSAILASTRIVDNNVRVSRLHVKIAELYVSLSLSVTSGNKCL